MPNQIITIEERLVYSDVKNKWVKLYFDRVRFPNGKDGYYNKIVESEGKEGVVILPIAQGHIGLVRQFRYPISADVWEIPRGFGETDNTEADAAREFLEETGIMMLPDNFINLGPVHPNSGILSSIVRIFAAIYRRFPPLAIKADEEISEFMWLQYSDVLSKIAAGAITDSFTMAALLRAQLKGLFDRSTNEKVKGVP